MALDLDRVASELLQAWAKIPKHFRNSATIRRTLQCRLFAVWSAEGWPVIADFYPPRISDRPVDVAVLNREDDKKIEWAFCIDELVTLYAVRSLSSFDASQKVIFTTHSLKKKVDESRFFLKPDIEHVHLELK